MPSLPKGRGRVKPVDKNKSWGGDTSEYRKRRWRKLRAFWIHQEPLCLHCLDEGRTTAADVVDHIVPVKQNGKMYDINNLQSLCHSHHNKKTQEENRHKRYDEE
tara:strand:+ start:275 stop:586 length:312 start_codon:yes stop_codon:yes gene_type:complete